MSENAAETVVMETNDIEKAQKVRAAIHKNFYGKRFWIRILNRGRKNGKPQYKVTVNNVWDGRLDNDETVSILDFMKQFKPDEPEKTQDEPQKEA